MSVIAVTNMELDPVVDVATVPKELHHFRDIDPEKMLIDVIGSKRLDTDIRSAVIDGRIEDPIDATPNVVLTIHDPDWELLNSGALTKSIDIEVGPRNYRLAGVDVQDDDLVCTFILRAAAYLMHHNKPRKANRKNTTRAEFIKLLVKSVKKIRINFVAKELHKPQKIEPVRTQRDNNRRPGLPSKRDSSITVKGVEADSEQRKNMEDVIDEGEEMGAPRRGKVGAIMTIIQESTARRSATAGQFVGLFQQSSRYGWPATRNARKDAHAFYEKFIPIVKEHPHGNLGEQAASVQRPADPEGWALSANRWRAEAEEVVDQYSGGGGLRSTEYKKRYEYETQEYEDGSRENYLAATYRLADEVQWRAFWTGDKTLHYASEEDLFKGRSIMRIERGDEAVERVRFSINGHKQVNSMTLTVRMDRWFAPIGSVVTFGPKKGTNMVAGAKVKDNPANGRWLITNISKSIFSDLGEIVLSKPVEEKLEPAPEIGTRQIDDGGRPSSGLPRGPGGSYVIDRSEGALSIVESCALIAGCPSGSVTSGPSDGPRVVSDFRFGDPLDHGLNNREKAARDIAWGNVNALTGPPHRDLDIAMELIADAFGFSYKRGDTIVHTIPNWHGYRVQFIWRTPLYGGHMGHIHVGARRLVAIQPQTGSPVA